MSRFYRVLEVLTVFARLGCTSFGGPVAHIAYFRREFVEQRRWLDDSQFAQLLAICQFLPGPASSQLGFSIGLLRAGIPGAIAAFVAFTLPSILLLLLFVMSLPYLAEDTAAAAIQGLKIVALVVVAQGVYGMMKQLCPDRFRQSVAVFSAVFVLLAPLAYSQVCLVVLVALLACLSVNKHTQFMPSLAKNAQVQAINIPLSFTISLVSGVLFLALLGLSFLPASFYGSGSSIAPLLAPFYQAGALVFGGGHVVLPLLEQSLVQTALIGADEFIAGYGASQAIPGPMFSFAAYLGAVMAPVNMPVVVAALIATLAVFLPGFLLLLTFLPWWQSLAQAPMAKGIIALVNACVVGILFATLYDPILLAALKANYFMPITLIGFFIQIIWQKSVLYLVAWCVFASVVTNYV